MKTAKWTFFIHSYDDHRELHSFPTRRSSDLAGGSRLTLQGRQLRLELGDALVARRQRRGYISGIEFLRNVLRAIGVDRKSTRLNSSHPSSSYAVFCLKKKKS